MADINFRGMQSEEERPVAIKKCWLLNSVKEAGTLDARKEGRSLGHVTCSWKVAKYYRRP